MSQPVFIFSAQGVATDATRFRAGARHALLLFGAGAESAAARSAALAGAEGKGWNFVKIERQKELDADLSSIEDETLRSAAQDAARQGHSMIVYRDELPFDA